MSGDIVIEAHGLTKTYGRATAVDHISFSVERGKCSGSSGPMARGRRPPS
jgi:ABC-2 type transport system ATP-binding protein